MSNTPYYMALSDLTDNQVFKLKQRILLDDAVERDRGVSWGELEEAESLVTDEQVYERFKDTMFTEDDFKPN